SNNIKKQRWVTQIARKEEVKLSLLAHDTILSSKDLKTHCKTLKLTITCSKLAGYKISIQKSVAFLCISNKFVKKKYWSGEIKIAFRIFH
ncbi:hypothetical protein ACQP3F_30615, partial [Escherichia coli]